MDAETVSSPASPVSDEALFVGMADEDAAAAARQAGQLDDDAALLDDAGMLLVVGALLASDAM